MSHASIARLALGAVLALAASHATAQPVRTTDPSGMPTPSTDKSGGPTPALDKSGGPTPATDKSGGPPPAPAGVAGPTPVKPSGPAVPVEERRFLESAARDGMAEVELGRVAQRNAQHAKVKEFGARMVTDHGKANDELKRLAAFKGITLPAAPDAAQARHLQEMQAKSGEAFDRAYMEHMVKEHREDVAAFEKQAAGAKDPDVKAFAAKTLPVLREHLKAAQAAHDAVKGAPAKGS
jgi:putative membrane protein